jgi:MATE family multidrug resistance protein
MRVRSLALVDLPGVWIGLSVGTLVYAALLVLRFRMLATRLETP